jgi:hypothetical protein
VLAGLGGVGKTQLAANHAYRLCAHHRLDLLAWITAGSRRDIQVAYVGLAARVFGPDANDSDSQGDAATRLLDWLASTRRRWLIVLDDLVEPHDLRGLWPPFLTYRADAGCAMVGVTWLSRATGGAAKPGRQDRQHR